MKKKKKKLASEAGREGDWGTEGHARLASPAKFFSQALAREPVNRLDTYDYKNPIALEIKLYP